jgi:nucleoid-associated protein YgaU
MHYYDIEEEVMLAGVDAQLGVALVLPPGETLPVEQPPNGHGGVWTEIKPGESTGSGWPADVAVVPGAWVSLDPPRYQIQGGDTWSGLAGTYLGAKTRWKDLWDAQDQAWRWGNDPDVLGVGWVVDMTPEARDNFVSWMQLGKPTEVVPGKLPPEIPKTTEAKIKSALPYVAAGVVAAVVIAAIAS